MGNADIIAATEEHPPFVAVCNVGQTYTSGARPLRALQEISFHVERSEFVCIVGTSGSGKSTLLRILGGLLRPTTGEVRLAGRPLREPPSEIAFVFQKSNLMPWRTVIENVLLPLEIQGSIGTLERTRAQEMLKTVGLDAFANEYPSQLSGGMAQRLALARALIQEPDLLLLDEPFGSLDALTRERLNLELLRLRRIRRQTVIMVTHSIDEAVFLADRVLVLGGQPGRLAAEIAIDLPRPRRMTLLEDPKYNRLRMTIRHHIGMES